MSFDKWPKWMIEMDPSDAIHGSYGHDNVSCNTRHCAVGWIAASFRCSVGRVFAATVEAPDSPVAQFTATLAKEMRAGRPDAGAVERTFEGWDADGMTAAQFARAWNRAIRRHGYNATFDRPERF